MVLDGLLDLLFELRRDRAGRDLLQQTLLRAGQVRAELELPASNLVDGDRVKL